MIIAKHRWSKTETIDNFETFIETFFANRQITDRQLFLNPQLEQLRDPLLMRDIQKAADIIHQQIDQGQLIYLYGDYDVDGVTSTSILFLSLRLLGANVKYLIPNRFTDGYGINSLQMKKMLEAGASLIVTVDNGISANQVFQEFENQAQFIIVDHHQLPDQLPKVDAIVHPQIGNYPFTELSASAVAFKLAEILFEDLPIEFIDLAALGLIADVMPLIDENRVMVKSGLELINQSENLGLKSLLAKLEIQAVTSQTVAYKIAPNLNAVGRIGDANQIVELLTTDDQNQIEKITEQVVVANQTRQKLVKEIVDQLLVEAKQATNQFLLFYHQDYSEGILGIVAARLVEETGKPTIIFNLSDDKLKGSARAPKGVNLFEILNQVKDLFTSFGGHAGAAGLSLNLKDFNKLDGYLQKVDLANIQSDSLLVDGQLAIDQINLEFYQKIQSLQPFGQANSEPQFLIESKLIDLKMLGHQGQHAKLILENNLEALSFNHPELSKLQIGQPVQIIGSLDLNRFQNKEIIQIMIKDITDQSTVIDRNFFAKVYQTIKNQKITVDQIDQQVLEVFLELGFVKITNGLIEAVDSPDKKELTQSATFSKRFA